MCPVYGRWPSTEDWIWTWGGAPSELKSYGKWRGTPIFSSLYSFFSCSYSFYSCGYIAIKKRWAVAAFEARMVKRSVRRKSARPHNASSSMVGLASWRPYGRGDASRLALLGPSRVGPQAPALPSIRAVYQTARAIGSVRTVRDLVGDPIVGAPRTLPGLSKEAPRVAVRGERPRVGRPGAGWIGLRPPPPWWGVVPVPSLVGGDPFGSLLG